MKILFGVQGTGNGHISRARALAKAFTAYPQLDIQWLFSGRPQDEFFDMQCFGDYQWRRGMTLVSEGGKLRVFRTVARSAPFTFLRDRRELSLDNYDLIISDYEPVTAWASRRAAIPALGIGHQYAFYHHVPEQGGNLVSRAVMRKFAPMPQALGLHWHHFGQPILPPIIDLDYMHPTSVIENKVLIYLPFEDNQRLINELEGLNQYQFYVYAPGLPNQDRGHIHTRPPSRDGFREDLANARRVVCNAGFELNSEALQLGKNILTKPVTGQMEQSSNALALSQLGLGQVAGTIDRNTLRDWLALPLEPPNIQYPNVAEAIASWIVTGRRQSISGFSSDLWSRVKGLPDWQPHRAYLSSTPSL